MSWYRVPPESPTEPYDGTPIPHPPGPEHDPADFYYEKDVWLPVRELWVDHLSARLSPELLFDALVTGHLRPPEAADLQPQLDEVRGRIENRHLETWGRKLHPVEWLAVFYGVGTVYILPDGTPLGWNAASACIGDLWRACAAEMPFARFALMLAKGLNPDPSENLTPELVKQISERRAELMDLITEARQAPPVPEDWWKLAVKSVLTANDETLLGLDPTIHHPAETEEPDDYYEGDEPFNLVWNLWSDCEAYMDPFAFAHFWMTGEPPPSLGTPELATALVADRARTRQKIEEAYRKALNRPPTENEWADLADPNSHGFLFPDGTLLDENTLFLLIHELQRIGALNLATERLIDLLTDGPTPENSADLNPELADQIADLREGMTEWMAEASQTRAQKASRGPLLAQAPLTRENWTALIESFREEPDTPADQAAPTPTL